MAGSNMTNASNPTITHQVHPGGSPIIGRQLAG
jgi:hypothetical protein